MKNTFIYKYKKLRNNIKDNCKKKYCSPVIKDYILIVEKKVI